MTTPSGLTLDAGALIAVERGDRWDAATARAAGVLCGSMTITSSPRIRKISRYSIPHDR